MLGPPHGIRGLVRARLHDPRSTALERGRTVTLVSPDGQRRQVEVEARGATRGSTLLWIAGVEDREQAEALKGWRIVVKRGTLDPLEQGQYYYTDLIGCLVFDEAGCSMGRVHTLFEAGASDVLVVRDGSVERYLPWVESWILAVDLQLKRITIRGDREAWEAWEV